jgi:Spy/CpxP family protein refolding chaperone
MYRTNFLILCLGLFTALAITTAAAAAQKKRPVKETPKKAAPPTNDSAKLRDNYIETVKEYKASLKRLIALYEASQRRAETDLAKLRELYQSGLVSRKQVDEGEHAVALEKAKVTEVQQQMATADIQIAQALVEIEGDKEIARMGPLRKGTFIQGASFIRYTGAGVWSISNAWKIQKFFADKFGRPLPVAVFGQGGIHDRWRLDHHNAMDISLKPDDPEGQALMNYMRSNGIPFSAFRVAIPNVATGPHIHIGMPSHRY